MYFAPVYGGISSKNAQLLSLWQLFVDLANRGEELRMNRGVPGADLRLVPPDALQFGQRDVFTLNVTVQYGLVQGVCPLHNYEPRLVWKIRMADQPETKFGARYPTACRKRDHISFVKRGENRGQRLVPARGFRRQGHLGPRARLRRSCLGRLKRLAENSERQKTNKSRHADCSRQSALAACTVRRGRTTEDSGKEHIFITGADISANPGHAHEYELGQKRRKTHPARRGGSALPYTAYRQECRMACSRVLRNHAGQDRDKHPRSQRVSSPSANAWALGRRSMQCLVSQARCP